jgi:hypothetical protein
VNSKRSIGGRYEEPDCSAQRSKDSWRAKPRKNLELNSIRACEAPSEPALWTFSQTGIAAARIYGMRMRANSEFGKARQ